MFPWQHCHVQSRSMEAVVCVNQHLHTVSLKCMQCNEKRDNLYKIPPFSDVFHRLSLLQLFPQQFECAVSSQ